MGIRSSILLLFVVIGIVVPSVCQAVVYVMWNSTSPVIDGTSWQTAYRTVQAGIDDAADRGDEVWVAAGTYDENITVPDGVRLYGGFAGSEASRDQRDWIRHTTILDGGKRASVVVISSDATASTVVSGFTIANGRSPWGGGIQCGGSPVISENRIAWNHAGEEYADMVYEALGGGIYCTGSPTIVNNTIFENTAFVATICSGCDDVYAYGGGIYIGQDAQPIIANNIISHNKARSYHHSREQSSGYAIGGGIYSESSAIPVITNNTVVGNRAIRLIWYQGHSHVSEASGGIAVAGSAMLANNIIAYNSAGIWVFEGGNVTLTHNCVYGNRHLNYYGTLPGTNDLQLDPEFADLRYGDLHIQPTSPCRNAGDNDALLPEWKDIDGQPRIQGTTVDIGADESDGSYWPPGPRVIIRVSPDGDDANHGLSWTYPKRTIRAAMDTASFQHGEVWGKAGTYHESVSLRTHNHVYGGFAGTEVSRDQRDWRVNETVLDGGGQGTVVSCTEVGADLCSIDGFTIRNGSGGIVCVRASPVVANNVITANSGSGIYVRGHNSSPKIIANRISDRGILCEYGPTPLIANNIMYSCSTAITWIESSPQIVNNTITDNVQGLEGIGEGYYAAIIANNIIAFNTEGIRVTDSCTLSNNCVYGNSGYDYWNMMPGSGDISLDPLFVDLINRDLRLEPISPCINGGSNEFSPQYDFDGNPRPSDGNAGGIKTCDIGAYEHGPWITRCRSTYPDGESALLGPVAVTASFPEQGFIYVQALDRSSGMRVGTSESLSEGSILHLMGEMATDHSTGERLVILSNTWLETVGGILTVRPLGLPNRFLGGGSMGLQRGVTGGSGLNNIGLLTKTWGTVAQIGDGYLYIDDGSGIRDGTSTGAEENVGVRVICDPTEYQTGDFLTVTGISSCFETGNGLARRILTRGPGGITKN